MLTNQKKISAVRLYQLAQLGYATPYDDEVLTQPEALVEQCAPSIECPLRDLGDQGSLYMVWLSVSAERPGVCLYDFRFLPPWPDRGFQTLASNDNCPPNTYVLPNGWSFPRETVLNWRFGKTGWRLPLTPVEGWLFAHSLTPVPPECKYGAQVEVGIEFFGKSGRRLAETDSILRLDRSIRLPRTRHTDADQPTAESASQPEQSPAEAPALDLRGNSESATEHRGNQPTQGSGPDGPIAARAEQQPLRRCSLFVGKDGSYAPPDWAVKVLGIAPADKESVERSETPLSDDERLARWRNAQHQRFEERQSGMKRPASEPEVPSENSKL